MSVLLCNQPEDMKKKLYSFAKNPKGFVVLAGKNGTGKTFIAEAIHRDFPCYDTDFNLFISQTQLNLKWQKFLNDYGETMYLLNQILQTKLLILDDIGTRVPSDAFMDFLYAIVDSRYRERDYRGTVITTNLNSADMRQKFGDAFVSRVASGLCFRFEGEDRRLIEF